MWPERFYLKMRRRKGSSGFGGLILTIFLLGWFYKWLNLSTLNTNLPRYIFHGKIMSLDKTDKDVKRLLALLESPIFSYVLKIFDTNPSQWKYQGGKNAKLVANRYVVFQDQNEQTEHVIASKLDPVCSGLQTCHDCIESSRCKWNSKSFECIESDAVLDSSWIDYNECRPLIFFHATGGDCTGGSEALVSLHNDLNSVGFRSHFYWVPPCGYDNEHTQNLAVFNCHYLNEGDTLLYCMGCTIPGDHLDCALKRHVRIYQLVLGHHHQLPISSVKQQEAMPVAGGMHSYVKDFSTGLKRILFSISDHWFEASRHVDVKLKQNIVLYDGDIDMTRITQFCKYENGSTIKFHHVKMEGFTRIKLTEMMLKTKVVLDLDLPGWEFGNLEAILLGAVFIGPNHQTALDKNDFPIPNDNLLFDDQDFESSIGRKMAKVFQNYQEEVGKMDRMIQLIHSLRSDQLSSLRSFFSDEVLFYIPAITETSYRKAMITAVGLILLYPHASVEVLTCVRTEYWVIDWDSTLTFLSSLSLGNSITISACNKTREFYGDNMIYVTPPRSRRRYTLVIPSGTIGLSEDMITRYSSYLADNSAIMVNCYDENMINLHHFVHTENYYRRISDIDADRVPPRSRNLDRRYLYQMLTTSPGLLDKSVTVCPMHVGSWITI